MDRYAACILSIDQSIEALCRHVISGLCYWYVDDLMALTLYINNSEIVDSNVQHLLGNGSIEVAKFQMDRCLEFLGWDFNLDTRTITLCQRNLHKFVHALSFFTNRQIINLSHPASCFIHVENINTI